MRKRVARGCVVGLDLSLRATAMCCIPLDWDLDVSRVVMGRAGYEIENADDEIEQAERRRQIAHDVDLFCLNARAKRVGIEAYAFRKQTSSVTKLAELGGVVRDCLLDSKLAFETINAAQARKTLLQNCPTKGAKEFAQRNVKRLIELNELVTAWTEDEIDAFVIANHILMRAGGIAMTFEGR